jgi:hypothetical protein
METSGELGASPDRRGGFSEELSPSERPVSYGAGFSSGVLRDTLPVHGLSASRGFRVCLSLFKRLSSPYGDRRFNRGINNRPMPMAVDTFRFEMPDSDITVMREDLFHGQPHYHFQQPTQSPGVR